MSKIEPGEKKKDPEEVRNREFAPLQTSSFTPDPSTKNADISDGSEIHFKALTRGVVRGRSIPERSHTIIVARLSTNGDSRIHPSDTRDAELASLKRSCWPRSISVL